MSPLGLQSMSDDLQVSSLLALIDQFCCPSPLEKLTKESARLHYQLWLRKQVLFAMLHGAMPVLSF